MKSVITIKCMRKLGEVTEEAVNADVFGKWAVHKAAKPGYGYSITFIPMGRCVGFANGMSKSACVRAARALEASDLKPRGKTERGLTRWFNANGAALAKVAWTALRGAK